MWKHCNFITLFYRAQIERENKDIRLEKIRVKAAEQRETVLQSIKLVVLSIPFTCFLKLPSFPPFLLHSVIVFFSPVSAFLFEHYYFSSPCLLCSDHEASFFKPPTTLLLACQQSYFCTFSPAPPFRGWVRLYPSCQASSSPPLISANFDQVPDTVLYDWYI